MPFSSLIGNPHAKNFLTRLVEQGTVGGTLLFSGPEGVGKKLFALSLAERLLEGNGTAYPDLHLYQPEGKLGLHPMDQIQQLIQEISLPPFGGSWKVFIIEDADRMLPSSSNALLKTLEEPPADTLMILLSHHPERLLPTILSRCRTLSFFSIPEKEIKAFVEETWKKTPAEARKIAYLSQGSMGRASQLATDGTDQIRPLLVDLLSQSKDYSSLLQLLTTLETLFEESCTEESTRLKKCDTLLEQIFFWYRDRHLLSVGGAMDLLFYHDHLKELKETKLPLLSLQKITKKIETCRLALQRSIKLRYVLEHLFLSLSP